MGDRSEVPPDDRGLAADATLEVARHSSDVEEALSIMEEKFAHLEGRAERIAAHPQVQRAEDIGGTAEKNLDQMASLKKEISDWFNAQKLPNDEKTAQLVNSLNDIISSYAQNKISLEIFVVKLTRYRDGLKGIKTL